MEKICEIERKREVGGLAGDILLFTVGFLFTRCHLVFGAHPIGLAFLAALPTGVWSALFGAVVGGISMGLKGIIFAATSAITVFLRAALSSDKNGDGVRHLFGESLLLRMSVSILGGFVSAVYEVMLSGLSEKTLAFGICMVVAPPVLTFIFSGLFSTGVSSAELISGAKERLSLRGLSTRERYEIIFFVISALVSIFFLGLSLREIAAFGISALYIFSGVITLLTAKRFGALYGMAAGFASSLSGSALLSVSFALAGLCAGGFFALGTGYAIIIGGVVLAGFSGYSSGLSGLLSTLPEYVISAALSLPLLKKINPSDKPVEEAESNDAEDMLGTIALVYQKEYSGATDALAEALTTLSGVIDEHGEELSESSDDYRLFARLIDAARQEDERERSVDGSMTESLTAAINECGFDGVIRAFGKRRPHFILAGADSGRRITSFEIRKSIENAAGVKLSAPECYRKGQTALMECSVRRKLSVSFAIAEAAGNETDVSGDIPICFETADDYFCALLCDGMGSGEVARATASFTSEFLRKAVESRADGDTLMLLLNRAVKSRKEECSSTVDLFKLDLIRGSGEFIKSGAAPSFIKRESSIFRIRSHTAPIGLLSSVDAEKTKVDIRPGDYIILMSDGVSDESEDAPWLLLLLGEDAPRSPKEYAERIISAARKNRLTRDDMSVIVIYVSEI